MSETAVDVSSPSEEPARSGGPLGLPSSGEELARTLSGAVAELLPAFLPPDPAGPSMRLGRSPCGSSGFRHVVAGKVRPVSDQPSHDRLTVLVASERRSWPHWGIR
jgi:hypothetical protein